MKIVKALSRQLFGAKYESVWKSLLAAVILFAAVNAAEVRVSIAPSILYLTSTLFTAGVMGEMLSGSRHREIMQGLLALPFENHRFVYACVAALGAHTLTTRTLPVWALFFAAAKWSGWEIAAALLCGCMACAVTSVACLTCRGKNVVVPIFWGAGILAVIVLVRESRAVLAVAVGSLAIAALYLYFADAYDFYRAAAAEKSARHAGRTGGVFTYLSRYLTANPHALVNTAGLCAVACLLPLPFGEFLNMFPVGLAILCLNTPVCTLLSCDPDLEQALRVLPGQAGRFGRRYGLFIFAVNGMVAGIYLCSWRFINGGVGLAGAGIAALFALQSAILSVMLEWKCPLRGWKTESDLWHHPRKYIVPLVMLPLAVWVAAWAAGIWVWTAAVLVECCILLYVTRK